MDFSAYEFSSLQEGQFTLHRGLGARLEPILLLACSDEYPSPRSLQRLEHEHALRADLSAEWAARPVELVRREGRLTLVLEDPGGRPLERMLGRPMDMTQFLRIAVALAAVIGRVHAQGLIHKDLKPANILVDASSGSVRLTGFGIASRLPRERQAPGPPEEIAGTLAYMPPEQTGRMNRSVDSRSDLYACGVTLYEMITGTLPFSASDPMEWIHCHIARQPRPPGELRIGLAGPVEAIILRLLAKSAEDRYQTAAGLEADLRRCLTEWETHGRIEPFSLGLRDVPDSLLIPERLYGREREIETMLAAFDRVVADGVTELVLVSGYSGVGKSSVVSELHKVLVPPRGLFAAGKFDQYKRDVPYTTLAQALRSLVRQILVKSETEVDQWRCALTEALEPNGQLIVSLVPELEFIIGKQPPVSELPPRDAQNRFQTVFRRFLGAFATPEHPLALFLDDLQWLDAATLDLLEHLLTHSDVRRLLLVGAYRDNEVSPSHPLMRTLEAIRKAGAKVTEIVLAPLELHDTGQLVADALHCEPGRARPLAELVQEKTGGNPFFAIQFFIALTDERLLAFDPVASGWQWNMDRIRAKSSTGNVVDLMAGKLKRFSTTAQYTLKQFACLGNVVPIATLTLVHETTEETIHAALGEAVHVGLVVREDGAYKFVHDRIQQAAYSLIPDERRAGVHLRIGRVLLANIAPDELVEHLFDIANQLNRGAALLVEREEKIRVATINLRAARRAKASAAYASAGVYLAAGIALLDETCWASQYELMFSLRLECAECEFLTGNLDEAERLIATLLQHGTTKVSLAAAYHLKILLHVVKSENPLAVASALACLRLFGIDLPAHPSWELVQAEYEAVWRNLDGRPIEDLVDLPLMTDPDLLAAMRLLSVLCDPAYVTDQNLLCLELCRAVNLGIRHGVSGAFAHACGYLGWPLATVFRRYPEGFRFAKLGYDLVEKHAFLAYRPKVQDATGIAAFWTKPMATSIDFVRASIRTALETGDLTYACYAVHHIVTLLLLRNEPLDAVWREAEIAREFVRDTKFRDMEDVIVPQQRFIAMMQGRTASIATFNDAQFDEGAFEAQLTGGRMSTMIFLYWTIKAKARFLAGAHAEALAAVDKATPLLWSSTGHFPLIDYYYYAALTVAALYENASAVERPRWDELLELRDQLREWSDVNRPSFGDKHALVSAEIARLEGREMEAMRLYEEAIALAREHGFVQNEGLAYEIAARFYTGRGFETFADAYLRNARSCYLRWGAHGKVRQIDRLYPHLAVAEGHGPTPTIGSTQQLDVASVVKASQALSSEIELPRLIERLMTIAIENGGADRGLLMLPAENDHLIQAEAKATGDRVEVTLGQRSITGITCPDSVVRYVIRTRGSVILDDASRPNLFSDDDYLRGRRVKSILCLPLIKQGRLTGLLYLENTLTSHVFTADRVAILELLAAQAAISLENTRLYNDLQEREGKVRRLIDSNIIGIFVWDFEGRVIETNEAFLHLLGHSRDDLVTGRARWTEWTPPEWSDTTERAVAELRATGTSKAYEKEFFRKDGARVPVLIGSATFGVGRDAGVSFVLDLTERKQAEAALRQSESYLSEAQAELAHVNRLTTVGQLTASIAHEINQPLAGIASNGAAGLNWLNRKQPDLDQARDAFSRIVRDSGRASDVIRGLRALVKKSGPQLARLDIDEVIREVLALTTVELRRRGVALQTDLAAGYRPVLGDRVQLQQVLLNLIMNGVEAMRGVTGRKRELMVSSTLADPGSVLVSVEDTGAGFDPAIAERLFEPFFTTKPEGLGMGLSICRSIVESHRGRLWASPRAPHGAAIRFTVPAETAQ